MIKTETLNEESKAADTAAFFDSGAGAALGEVAVLTSTNSRPTLEESLAAKKALDAMLPADKAEESKLVSRWQSAYYATDASIRFTAEAPEDAQLFARYCALTETAGYLSDPAFTSAV